MKTIYWVSRHKLRVFYIAFSIISSCNYLSLTKLRIAPDVYHSRKFTQHAWFRRLASFAPKRYNNFPYHCFKAFPLDMSQYPNLFRSTRIPGTEKDELKRWEDSRHVVVMRNGLVYALDVIDENGHLYPVSGLRSAIEAIMQHADKNASNGLGVLTTENRTTWARLREEIVLNEGNREMLHKIDTGLFVLCLDSTSPSGSNQISRNMLAGNAENRWFDKSFQIIVCENGKAAVNFEHSWGDGIAVLRFMNDIYNDINKAPLSSDFQSVPPAPFHEINLSINSTVREGIENAKDAYKEFESTLLVDNIMFKKMGKKVLKLRKMSPDGIMQLAFQLAYFRQYHKQVSTYESASTAAFKGGRTEVVRPATLEARKFVEAMLDPQVPKSRRFTCLDNALHAHRSLVVNANAGIGVDRHLFGLLSIAKKHGFPTPKIFTDKAYQVLNHNTLSTSTLVSKAVSGGGFGAVVPDGYGIGYAIQDYQCGCNVTCFKSPRTNLPLFIYNLNASFEDIFEVIT